MLRQTWILLVAAGVCVCTASASAQSQSLFGNSGPLGQSGASRTSSGTVSTTGRTGATQGIGGTSGIGGSSGIGGQGGLGGSGATGGSGTAFGGPQLNEVGSLSANAVGNSTGFVGQTNQGFAGNRLAGQTSAVAPGPTFTAPSGGNFDPNSFQQNSGQSSTRQIRPRYRVSFDTGTFAPAEVTTRAEAQIARLTARTPALAGVSIAIDDQGIAQIRGTAPDRDTSRLIENVVRMEPGVRGIDNQLVVAQP